MAFYIALEFFFGSVLLHKIINHTLMVAFYYSIMAFFHKDIGTLYLIFGFASGIVGLILFVFFFFNFVKYGILSKYKSFYIFLNYAIKRVKLFHVQLLVILFLGSLSHLIRQTSEYELDLSFIVYISIVITLWFFVVCKAYWSRSSEKSWDFSFYWIDPLSEGLVLYYLVMLLYWSFFSFFFFVIFILLCLAYSVVILDIVFVVKWVALLRLRTSKMFLAFYFLLLFVIALSGFYQLIFVSVWYIEVPHFMDIGPAQALYPIVDHNFKLPPNALMHDVFNYMTNSPFICVDSYSLANASRSFYFTLHNFTENSPAYVPGLIRWDAALVDLGKNIPSDLTKFQTVLHWIIVSDLLPWINNEYMAKLNRNGVVIGDLANIYDLHIYHPSFLGIRGKSPEYMFLYILADNDVRAVCQRPALLAEGSILQLQVLELLEKDVTLASSDEIILRALGYRLPGPVSGYTLPSIASNEAILSWPLGGETSRFRRR